MNKAKLRTILISSDTTLKESMQKLNDTAEQILFVTDEHDKFLGTVTDGDIRRGLEGDELLYLWNSLLQRKLK